MVAQESRHGQMARHSAQAGARQPAAEPGADLSLTGRSGAASGSNTSGVLEEGRERFERRSEPARTRAWTPAEAKALLKQGGQLATRNRT